jgi:hypothetical protein
VRGGGEAHLALGEHCLAALLYIGAAIARRVLRRFSRYMTREHEGETCAAHMQADDDGITRAGAARLQVHEHCGDALPTVLCVEAVVEVVEMRLQCVQCSGPELSARLTSITHPLA